MEFEWDVGKALSNIDKHGVPFEIAIQVFRDEGKITTHDLRFDYGEDRLISSGFIGGRLHVVVHVDNAAKQTVRLISARKANRRERKDHGTR